MTSYSFFEGLMVSLSQYNACLITPFFSNLLMELMMKPFVILNFPYCRQRVTKSRSSFLVNDSLNP